MPSPLRSRGTLAATAASSDGGLLAVARVPAASFRFYGVGERSTRSCDVETGGAVQVAVGEAGERLAVRVRRDPELVGAALGSVGHDVVDLLAFGGVGDGSDAVDEGHPDVWAKPAV